MLVGQHKRVAQEKRPKYLRAQVRHTLHSSLKSDDDIDGRNDVFERTLFTHPKKQPCGSESMIFMQISRFRAVLPVS